ncbi:hypothetical protein F5887DRAFT_1082782 [Amanita rubescens]|nr:hypothetical protein F5887DRAFT_1082782 [Amanita rubescens]
MSGIIPSIVANGDSPKRLKSNKAAPIHSNDAFIKEQLVKGNFCIKTNFRNSAVAGKVTQSKPSASNGRGKPIDSAWNTLRDVLKSSKKEKTIYAPLCRFLTLLANKEFLFIPWDHKTQGEDELYRQDIIVVNAQPDEIDRFLNGKQAMDQLPSEFTYHEGGKLKPRIHYSNVQMVGEVKPGVAPESPFENAVQVLKYLFSVSRYQPQHASHIGILVYCDGFFIIDYYPDQAFFSKLFKWEEKDAAWEALRSAIADVRRRPFTTKQFASIKSLDRHGLSHLQFSLSGDFTASDAQVYRLFDLHRGQGYHRNAYVGIGKVIKHYWHDMGRRFNELEILKKIHSPSSKKKLCTAGIVRVDLQESMELGEDITPTLGQPVERQSVLLIMKTLGRALATCPSVMKFLKVMYDLVEVHRMLVEDHDILHRDISWTNVLIDAIHLEGDNHDDFCGRPFIDAILGVEEKAKKVHATLADFDCACILGSTNKLREPQTIGGEITGTPMFISKALCLLPSKLNRLTPLFGWACEQVFPGDLTGVHQRQQEVTAFLQVVRQLDDNYKGPSIPQVVVHTAMHDAESIFWLIVLFFLRASPKGYDPKSDPNEPKRRQARTDTFKSFARNQIGTVLDSRGTPEIDMLPPQLHRFCDMLSRLDHYFCRAWHVLGTSEGQHRFHAHNALQSVLLAEIKNLQADNSEIEINPTPLGVDDNPALIPLSQSCFSTKRSAPDEPDEPAGSPKTKKQKVLHGSAVGVLDNNLEATSSDGPVLSSLMSAMGCDRRSKLWFMGDRDYVEYAFVEGGSEIDQKLAELTQNRA